MLLQGFVLILQQCKVIKYSSTILYIKTNSIAPKLNFISHTLSCVYILTQLHFRLY